MSGLGFISPWMLAGLAAGGIPFVIVRSPHVCHPEESRCDIGTAKDLTDRPGLRVGPCDSHARPLVQCVTLHSRSDDKSAQDARKGRQTGRDVTTRGSYPRAWIRSSSGARAMSPRSSAMR